MKKTLRETPRFLDRILTSELIKRFWAKVDIKGEDECWLWKRCVQKNGYGRFGISKRVTVYAHRLAIVISGRKLFIGKVAHHTCGVRRCANPKHLESFSSSENNMDKNANLSETAQTPVTTAFEESQEPNYGFPELGDVRSEYF